MVVKAVVYFTETVRPPTPKNVEITFTFYNKYVCRRQSKTFLTFNLFRLIAAAIVFNVVILNYAD